MIEFRDNRWINVVSNPATRPVDRLSAFVADLLAADRGPGKAILVVAERFTSLLAERVTRAPLKAKLAFLDAIGVEPFPSQPARCPLVFEIPSGSGHARAAEHSQVGATSNDGTVIFETESGIGLAASRLVDVRTVLPGNRYSDHSLDVIGERSLVLFSGDQPIPQLIYLAHDPFFAVVPGSVIELQWELSESSRPVAKVQWEYWDGAGWTPFAPFAPGSNRPPAVSQENSGNSATASVADDTNGYSEDGTLNLTRSGTIRLRASGKPAEQTTIRGIKSFWIRGRVVPIDAHDAASTTTDSNAIQMVHRLQLLNVSSVDGFAIRNQSPTLPINGLANRKLRIRLTDDSGSPLTLIDSRVGYSVSELGGLQVQIGAGDDEGLFVIHSQSADELRLRVSWGPQLANGQPDGAAIHAWDLPPITKLALDRTYEIEVARQGRLPTLAFGSGINIDPSIVFQPFGALPQPGATFLFACPEVLSKSGAQVTIFVEVNNDIDTSLQPPQTPRVRWEYWNGTVWTSLPGLKVEPGANVSDVLAFVRSGEIQFTVPANITIKQEFGQEQLWIRAHLVTGSYLVPNGGVASVELPSGSGTQTVRFDKTFPPTVQKLRLEYVYTSLSEPAAQCLTQSDFRWSDRTIAASFGGAPFAPFHTAEETRPVLYLGFSNSLPTDFISLFINIKRSQSEPDLTWEYHDGANWRRLVLSKDETAGLSQPGLVQFVWPGTPLLPPPEPLALAEGYTLTFQDPRQAARFRQGDSVAVFQDEFAETGTVATVSNGTLTLTAPLENKFSAAVAGFSPLPRFGKPRYWVRVVWRQTEIPRPGDDDAFQLSGLYLNSVWARQTNSVTNELLGGTNGTDGETFDLANRPVLRGERVEILELAGPLANSGWRGLLEELTTAGQPESDLVLDRDEKTGLVIRAWVRWQRRPNFSGSNPDDRHYVLEPVNGKLMFGDGLAGRVPPVNPNNVRVSYQSGGGRKGNVPARSVTTVMGSVTAAQVVFNPIAASGGADGEISINDAQSQIVAFSNRGPQLIRHRHRAITTEDYEQLARAASPGVAGARVVTHVATRGMVRAGTVEIAILPHTDVTDPQPQPSTELIREVKQYLQARAPASLVGRVMVKGPTYFHVGVEVSLVPVTPDAAGQLYRMAENSISRYLHPVVGGPDGQGWGFGQAIHRSTLVKWLHEDKDVKPYLAFVQELRLLDAGVAALEELAIPAGQVPCAGPIRLVVDSNTEVCQ